MKYHNMFDVTKTNKPNNSCPFIRNVIKISKMSRKCKNPNYQNSSSLKIVFFEILLIIMYIIFMYICCMSSFTLDI